MNRSLSRWQKATLAHGLTGRWAERLAEELAAHQQDLVDAALAQGMTANAAETVARLELGDPEQLMGVARASRVCEREWFHVALTHGGVIMCSRWLLAALGGAAMTASLLLSLTLTIYAGA